VTVITNLTAFNKTKLTVKLAMNKHGLISCIGVNAACLHGIDWTDIQTASRTCPALKSVIM